MRPRPSSPLLLAAIFVASCGSAGCFTLVGLGVGAGIDADVPDSVVVAGDDLMSVPSGSSGFLVRNDGSGRDVRDVRPWLESPAAHRADIIRSLGDTLFPLPLPLDTVRIVLGSTLVRESVLHGYCNTGVWVTPTLSRDAMLVGWERVTGVRMASGRVWTGAELRDAFIDLRLPSRSGLRVRFGGKTPEELLTESDDAEHHVLATDVRGLRMASSSNSVWWCMIAGVAVDIVMAQLLLRGQPLVYLSLGNK